MTDVELDARITALEEDADTDPTNGKLYFCIIMSLLQLIIQIFLPPATKLGQGYIFTGICHSVKRGVWYEADPPGADTSLEQTPLWSRYPPEQIPYRADNPSGSRHPALRKQTPPWETDTPQEQTPPEQTPPRSRHLPWNQVHPPGTKYTPLGLSTPQD